MERMMLAVSDLPSTSQPLITGGFRGQVKAINGQAVRADPQQNLDRRVFEDDVFLPKEDDRSLRINLKRSLVTYMEGCRDRKESLRCLAE